MIRSPNTFKSKRVSHALGMEAFVILNLEKVESTEMIKKKRDIIQMNSPPRTVEFELYPPSKSEQNMSTPPQSSNSLS